MGLVGGFGGGWEGGWVVLAVCVGLVVCGFGSLGGTSQRPAKGNRDGTAGCCMILCVRRARVA